MKNVFPLIVYISGMLILSSCSGGKEEKNPNSTPEKQVTANDTALNGKVGVIEAHPPIQEGIYVDKYPNGIIRMKGFYVNGKRNGQWTSFFQNGNIQSEGFFKDGLRDGKALVYYENGQIYYEGYYNLGKETGKWTFYDQKGNVVTIKNYD